ncbi:MAG: hypothetical protein ACI9UJ_000289 [bacterium]|jgi:hypothetical protein
MDNNWDISSSESQLLFSEIYDLSPVTAHNDVEIATKIPAAETVPKDVYLVCADALTEDMSTFLTKVMQSVNKVDQDYQIVSQGDDVPANTKTVLHFGQGAALKTMYTLEEVNNQIHCTFDSIKLIMNDNQKKRQLWECLKSAFKPSQ